MKALILAGPTAAGKTALAIQVAERFEAVVLSADAMQIYVGMDIGTAKTSREDRDRVHHEGIDLRAPDQAFDAADFVSLADQVLARFPRVVVAGGTSLYLKSMIRGLVATPPVDPELRAELEALPDPHAELMQVDPALAARLHPNDRLRVVRGLEVFRATGQRLSSLHEEHALAPDRVQAKGFWLDRDDLNARIDARVLSMIQAGYVDEVRGLLERGYPRTLKPMLSLGYRHICDHVLDGLDLAEAITRTQRDTRTFARKQRNWMRVLEFDKLVDQSAEPVFRAAETLWG